MAIRGLLAVAALLLAIPSPTQAASPSSDLNIVRHASAALGHSSRASVVHWLRAQAPVRSVTLGRDHRTIDISFRDGPEMLIVPRSFSTRALPLRSPAQPHARPAQVSGAKALVLEPFATALGMGPAAGQVERDDLTQAGFAVTEFDDTAVTVDVMATMAQYGVVYMHTHSGTTAGGEGILVSGQLATTDPCPSEQPSQCPVIVSGVYGSSQLYYAVTSVFVQQSMGTFSPTSILFFNGCAFLPATRFWNALSARGAGVMVSWDNDSLAYDDYLNGAAFFNQMVTGSSVSTAINTLKAGGYAVSVWNGVTSHLGYVGNGSLTLAQARQGGSSPTATPVPTRTSVSPTATPRPTGSVPPTQVPPTAVPSATSVPASIAVAHSTVKPGEQQVVTVRADPNRQVDLLVRFPNRPQISTTLRADASGSASYTLTQPANAISRHSRTALVDAEVQGPSTGQFTALSAKYTIAYGKIDLSSSAIVHNSTRSVTIWVHAHARSTVKGTVRAPGTSATHFTVKTGKNGWVSYKYHLTRALAAGQKVAIKGQVTLKGHVYKTSLRAVVR
jgi:hypothetical protein